MGHKLICFKCRKSFSIGTDYSVEHSNVCPNCGNAMAMVDQKFKPPKYVRDLVPDMSRYKTRLRAGGRNNVAARSQ
jgi:DNA-directed RNA polymerase subunit RPC12/RpoP